MCGTLGAPPMEWLERTGIRSLMSFLDGPLVVTQRSHPSMVEFTLCALRMHSSPIFPIPMLRELDWVKSTTASSELIVPN